MLTLRPFSRRIVAGRLCPRRVQPMLLSFRAGFVTLALACTLDSLVRVSRRGIEMHFRPSHCRSTDLGKSKKEKRQSITHKELSPAQNLVQGQTHWESRAGKHHSGDLSGHYPPLRIYIPTRDPQQFQVLFNSLFKVLCIFPSRYLCTIGVPPIFSFRWNLPPNLSCNPKQLDS